jgi:omega-6 fatty acid desaturase (delta-12 desaturase)
MTESTTSANVEPTEWVRVLARYGVPDHKRSVFELLATIVPFFALWALMLLGYWHFGTWAVLLLVLPAAGFLVRMFVIQHDCGHGSFFRARAANDWLGRCLSVLTMIPYDYWRRTHAVHHASSGNLDRRGMGDVQLLTVAEFRAMPLLQRTLYRVGRNPLAMLVVGPFWLFVLKYRFPVGLMRGGFAPWASAMATNLVIAGIAAGMVLLVGWRAFLVIQLPVTVLAGAAGIWLFYVQHQFENTYFVRQGEWNFHTAALEGSTFYDLPAVLAWFTANIGVHPVHHLASRIPCYRLPEALADHPELRDVGRLTLRESLRCFRLALWDEEAGRLVSFRALS